jgi:hypothetical protein
MATKKRARSNGENAKRSTGPRARAGKWKSSTNSREQGLFREFHLIKGEDPEEFSKFEEGSRVVLKPENALEDYYFKRFIQDSCRVDRFDNVMSTMLVNKESVDDLSLDDLLKAIKLLNDEFIQAFDRIPAIDKYLRAREASNRDQQATAQNTSEANSRWNTKSPHFVDFLTSGLELSAAKMSLAKNLNDRLRRAHPATNKAQNTPADGKTDGAESESGAPLNLMAQNFSRRREAVALLLRWRGQIARSRDNALHELQRLQAARRGQFVAAPEMVDVNVNITGKEEKPEI